MKKKIMTTTNIIILICILVYIIDRFFLGSNPVDIEENLTITIGGQNLNSNVLFIKILGLNFGKLYEIMALTFIDGKILNFWQPFTYIFMHQFILHIIVNLIALYIVGNNIEKNRGVGLTLFSFIIVGVLGVFISNMLVSGDSLIAGTSISVFGLIGTGLGMCLTEKGYIKSFSKKAKIYLIVYGLIFTYTSGTWTMVAHNIGLILGLLIYLIYYFLIYKKKQNLIG